MTTESMPKKKSNTMWYVIAAVVIVVTVIGVVVYVALPKGTTPTNATPMILYEGEVSTSSYGFGTTSSLTSPGPPITLTSGVTYKMTVNNVGTMAHNWAIVNAKDTNAAVQFSAKINTITQGSSGSVTFTAGSAGTYYYICQIPGHVALGMWGTVTVVNP